MAGEGSWLEAPGLLWCPCSAASFVQVCSLTVKSNVVVQLPRTSILGIHQTGGDSWSHLREDQLWEAVDCPTALGECSAQWMVADLSSQWYSVILVESCQTPTRTAAHVEDSVSRIISDNKLWDSGWECCKWELNSGIVQLGPLTHTERGALPTFLACRLWKAHDSVNRWRTTGEIFRALKTT